MITIISTQDWEYIGGRSPIRKWARPFCRYVLVEKGDHILRRAEIRLLPYLLLLIPVSIITFIACAWDGGLKGFSLPPIRIRVDNIEPNTEEWARTKEILSQAIGG